MGRMRAFLLPVMGISMVFVMLIPIPAFLLDLLLAASIALALAGPGSPALAKPAKTARR